MGATLSLGTGLTSLRRAWSPLALQGLKAWCEPDRAVYQDTAMTIPAVPGDPVGGLPDLSGNGYHAGQPTQALKPTLLAAAFPSGRAGLAFDGVDDRLILTNLGALFSGQDVPFSVGIVYRLDDGTNRAIQGLGNISTSTPYSMVYSNGASLVHYRRDDASLSASLIGPVAAVGQTQVAVITFGETPGVLARVRINITAEQSGPMDVGNTTLNRFVIGATERAGTVLYPFRGRIGAWVVVARALASWERSALASYLMGWAGV